MTNHKQTTSSWGHRGITLMLVLLGIIIAIPPECYRSRVLIEHPYVTLENSHRYGLPFRMGQGDLVGRDIVFSYGPLFQFITGLGLLVPNGDLASVIRWHEPPKVILSLLAVWGILSLTGGPLAWRGVLYLLWAALYVAPFGEQMVSIKPIGALWSGMFAAALLAPGNEGSLGASRFNALKFLFWFIAPLVLLAYSFDVGLFTFAIFLATALIVGVAAPRLRRPSAVAAAATILGFATLVVILFSLPAWKEYLPNSWSFTSGYAATSSLPLSSGWLITLVVAGFVNLAIGGVAVVALHREATSNTIDLQKLRPLLALVGGACFSLLWLRYGLSRSDAFHVSRALAPTVLFVGAAVPCYLAFIEKWSPLRWGLPLLLIFISVRSPAAFASLQSRLEAVGDLDFRPAVLEVTHPVLGPAIESVRQLPAETVYVWPFETIIAAAANKRSPDYTLQSYAAFSEDLQEETITHLNAVDDLAVLLNRTSGGLDGVKNMTRTSHIFRHLLENYELAEPPHDAFAILQRADRQSRGWYEETVIGSDEAVSFVPQPDAGVVISLPPNQVRVSDILVVRLRAAYQSMYSVGKHGIVCIRLTCSDGTQRDLRIPLVQDGASHDFLISAMGLEDPLFLTLFESSKRQWRASESVDQLTVWWQEDDLFSRRPKEITVEQVSLLRRENVENVETSRNEDVTTELFDWVYDGGPRP